MTINSFERALQLGYRVSTITKPKPNPRIRCIECLHNPCHDYFCVTGNHHVGSSLRLCAQFKAVPEFLL